MYKINKITSVEGIPTIKIRGQDKKKNKNHPKLFTTQHRIINSKLSLRRSEADAVASLKFIILGVTRGEN